MSDSVESPARPFYPQSVKRSLEGATVANDLQSDPSDPQLAIGMRIRALRAEVGSVESKLRLAEAPSVLVAVTKTMPETAIRVALEAGHRVSGKTASRRRLQNGHVCAKTTLISSSTSSARFRRTR